MLQIHYWRRRAVLDEGAISLAVWTADRLLHIDPRQFDELLWRQPKGFTIGIIGGRSTRFRCLALVFGELDLHLRLNALFLCSGLNAGPATTRMRSFSEAAIR